MSEQEKREVERGPNGFPYVEMDESRVTGWQNGEFHLKIERTDFEMLRTNFEPEQFQALRDAVDDTLREAAKHPDVDYYGESDDELTHCVECGKILDDPKNRGDPDVNGEWVCGDSDCRELHDAEMTCDGSAELVTDGGTQQTPTTADGTDMSFVAGSKKDAWRTPPALYDPIAQRIGGFELDPCAGPPPEQLELPGEEEPDPDLEPTEIAEWNVTLPTDGLQIDWYGDVWLNPPFSEKGDWLEKAETEWRHGDADRVFIVTPDATDVAAWWHEFIVPNAAVTYFVESRTDYIDPATADTASGVSFNTAVSVFGEAPPELLRYWRDAGDLVVRPWNEGWSL